jgi:peptidyl-prolyl cis-trans isomerase A (cyclophilin A)
MRTCVALAVALALGACGGEGAGRTAEAAPDSAAEPPPHPLLDLRAMRDTAPPTFQVRMETTAGPLVIDVHRDWSPRGVDRFYNLVQAGYYDSVYVHRVIPGVIAQFGFYRDARINGVWLQRPVGDDPVIGRTNARGTVTFAHSGMNTRTAQVFINLRDNPQFDDDEFVPFGEVTQGMENADRFYDGYGELMPEGKGPDPGQAAYRGNPYLKEGFPELSQIIRATIVDDPAGAPPRP